MSDFIGGQTHAALDGDHAIFTVSTTENICVDDP